MVTGPDETNDLLRRAAAGDQAAWGELLTRHRERLRRMIALRQDRRLQGRLDPSDVLQEACLEASARLAEYLHNPSMPFYLWLRFLTGQKLLALQRRHLGAQKRSAGREVSLDRGLFPETTSDGLAAHLLGDDTGPSEAAMRAELKAQLREALDRLDPLDREALALRHFEQLTTVEVAQVLGISEAAASKRYLRALKRLKDVLVRLPGGPGGLLP
jgi:RNA polymerase sigma-70 factor (ECF subfamily)